MAPPEQSWCCPKLFQSIPNSQLRVVLPIKPGPNDSSSVSLPKSSPARLVGSELEHLGGEYLYWPAGPDRTQAGCRRNVRRDDVRPTTARRARKRAVWFPPKRDVGLGPTPARGTAIRLEGFDLT